MEIGHLTPAGQSGSFSIGTRETERTLNDLPEAHLKLLDDVVTASMSCLNRNGTIHISPVWVNRDNEHILVNSVRGRQKDRNLRLRRHASLLFIDPESSYHWISIQGVVDDIIDEDDPVRGSVATDSINHLSQMYLGESTYPLRDPDGTEVRSLYRIRPTRVVVLGGASAAGVASPIESRLRGTGPG
jgi:PPOX class probable F420-dependent enzyme